MHLKSLRPKFLDHHPVALYTTLQANVVTSSLTPTHLARMSKAEAADTESAISAYVDAVLLARAQCAVYSRSGFSATAWMMGGGTDCYEHIARDLQSCRV
jgi:hypothetical protein